MDTTKGVFLGFIICATVTYSFEPDVSRMAYTWKKAKHTLCLRQNKDFVGRNIWERIKEGSYNPNTTIWLNGLVLRCPVMNYHGCFNIKFESDSEKLLEKNQFINCSKTCEKELKNTDGSFIALMGNACHCFKPEDQILENVSSLKCFGHVIENSNNTHRDIYKVYGYTHIEIDEMIGMNCFSKSKRTNCSAELKFRCQNVTVEPYSVYTECSSMYLTHEDALNDCQRNTMYINSDSDACDKGSLGDEEIWRSVYAEETVLWDADADFDFDEEIYQCLLAVYDGTNKNYILKSEPCNKTHPGICLFQSEDHTTRSNILITSDYSISTPIIKLFDSRDESNHIEWALCYKDNTGMIVGIVSGIVLSAGLSIAGLIFWKGQSKHTSVTRTTGSLYYSTVQSSELSDQQLTTPRDYNYTEYPGHLISTEEGHYNHLGDNELQQNLCDGPVYEHSGMDMNLYDTSATHGRQSADPYGVYDCNAFTTEYSFMNDSKKLPGPDDTYDHT